jgi:porin
MSHSTRSTLGKAFVAGACLLGAPAFAADARPEWLPEGSLGTGLPMLADPGGLRAALWERGVKYQVNYIGDLLANQSGGLKRGTAFSGRLELVVDADLEKTAGWTGAAFHANAYLIQGSGLSRSYVGNLMTVSNVEALPATRLYEAWIEQKLADGKMAVRAGQLGADTEFVTSSYASLFINGTFGWPVIHATDLPTGGPSYPLATPGVRLGFYPTDQLSLLVGLFNGDPAGFSVNDAQVVNRHGLNFRVNDPAFLISEVQFKYGDEKSPAGLSGTAKLGAWTHFGKFADQRFDTAGLSLANLSSSGEALQRRGNRGVYGVIDQQVWRLADDPAKGVGVFARIAGAPGDRNLIDFYADAGVNVSGVIASRPDDAFGVALAYARISRATVGLDQDKIVQTGSALPVRSSEMVLEATYSAQVAPGWTLQPNVQYVVRPGGGMDPYNSDRALKHATIFGLRTGLKF